MADTLRKERDVEVEVVDGSRGEFSVLLDGQMIVEKHDENYPTPEEITNAVRKAPTPVGV